MKNVGETGTSRFRAERDPWQKTNNRKLSFAHLNWLCLLDQSQAVVQTQNGSHCRMLQAVSLKVVGTAVCLGFTECPLAM